MRTLKVALLLALALATAAGDESVLPRPDVYSLHIVSEVQNRYAKTLVTSRVANTANVSREITFDAVLPETAFISGFIIEMDGKAYEAYVRGKEEARKEYEDAVQAGRGAAHVELSARDSNVVSVSVNVEAQKKVTFNLTYEELLQRELGAYNLRINLDPGQIVDDLSVEVHINETSDITLLEVPSLQESNEITDDVHNSSNPLAHIKRSAPSTATVRWAPTREEQAALKADGVKGQLLVRYDVDHAANPNQILVSDDGYFVHFYSPSDLQTLPKHVVFVLDVSGSMHGHKIDQLRQAMLSILDELRPQDNFTLITFSSDSQVWRPPAVPSKSSPGGEPSSEPEDTADDIVSATPENIAKAKDYVKRLESGGGTGMHRALDTAMRVSEAGGRREGAPLMLVLLTDGQPTDSSTEGIVTDLTATNTKRGASFFTLAFGEDADFSFLKRLALRNGGFGRRIYEAGDAHLQLRNFFRQIASPLLSSVNFTYGDGQVDEESLTRTKFPTLFRGGEIVVAGKLKPSMPPLEPVVVGQGTNVTTSVAKRTHVSSGERLWAFLTVRQLLDLDSTTPNKTLKDRAKDIALKYSFVTPVTSLVVVKPNETSAVDPERAGGNRGGYFGGSFQHFGAGGFSGGRLHNRIAYHSLPAAIPIAAFFPGPAPLGGPSLPAPRPPPLQPVFGPAPPAEEALLLPVPPPTTRQPLLDVPPQPQLHNISEISWLDSMNFTTEVNGTTKTLQLATNQTEVHLDICSTTVGGPGTCRHLVNCVLPVFLNNVTDFMPYLCVVDDSYIGACCPDAVHFSHG